MRGGYVPGISVCMLTYNHAPYIQRAINSVLEQVIDVPLRLVIGDHSSIDGTREICEIAARTNPTLVTLLCTPREAAESYAAPYMPNLKNVLEKCGTEYVAILDGDDFWVDPFKLQKQWHCLRGNSKWSASFTQTEMVDHYGRVLRRMRCSTGPVGALGFTLNAYSLATPSMMFRRSVLPSVIPDYFDKVYAADYLIKMHCFAYGPSYVLPDVCARYTVHVGSYWSSVAVRTAEERMLSDLKIVRAAQIISEPSVHLALALITSARKLRLSVMVYLPFVWACYLRFRALAVSLLMNSRSVRKTENREAYPT